MHGFFISLPSSSLTFPDIEIFGVRSAGDFNFLRRGGAGHCRAQVLGRMIPQRNFESGLAWQFGQLL